MTYEIYKLLGSEVVLSPGGYSHPSLFSVSSGSFATGKFQFPHLHVLKFNPSTGLFNKAKSPVVNV